MQARQIFAKDKKIFYRFYGFPFLFFLSGNPEYTTEKRRKKNKTKNNTFRLKITFDMCNRNQISGVV